MAHNTALLHDMHGCHELQSLAAEAHDNARFYCRAVRYIEDGPMEMLLHLQRLLPSEPQSSACQRPWLPKAKRPQTLFLTEA